MKARSSMSPELIGILGVGVSLAGLILSVVLIGGSWIVDSFRAIDSRLDQLERNQAVLLERTKHLDPVTAESGSGISLQAKIESKHPEGKD